MERQKSKIPVASLVTKASLAVCHVQSFAETRNRTSYPSQVGQMQLVGKENTNSNTTYETSRVSMGSFLFPFIIQTQGARHVVDTALLLSNTCYSL